MNKAFTVTIKDNKTEEIKTKETNAIFAVIDTDEGTWNVFHASCDGFALTSLFCGIHKLFEKVKSDHAGIWSVAEGFMEFLKAGENDE